MNETTKIPKFRTARRLVQWMERNWHSLIANGGSARLPADRERVFLTTKKEKPEEVAACVSRYSHWAGRLSPEIESLMLCHHDSLVVYLIAVHNKEEEFPSYLLENLRGDNRNLWRVAKRIGRLPENLEDSMGEGEAKYAFLYAKEVLRGRLPENLEGVFFKDTYYAAKYAFEVIRGFSSVRLPEALHNMMVMKSYEDPSNEDVKAYLDAAENDPDKVGNATETV